MSNRTWIVIAAIGIGSVVALGMTMGYVVESNPSLKSAIKFKQSLARDFSARGIEEVSLRNMPKNLGFHLLLTATLPDDDAERDRLDRDVVEYFVREHGDKRARVLKISYLRPPSWGCRSAMAEPHRVKEFPLRPIRQRLARAQKEIQLAAFLEERLGCRLVACQSEDGELRVRVDVVRADATANTRDLVKRVERSIRGRLRAYYSTLHLTVLGVGKEDTDGGETRDRSAGESPSRRLPKVGDAGAAAPESKRPPKVGDAGAAAPESRPDVPEDSSTAGTAKEDRGDGSRGRGAPVKRILFEGKFNRRGIKER